MRLAILVCLLCGLGGGGCMREVEVIACREPNGLREVPAPTTANYTLWRQHRKGVEHVVWSAQLAKGDPLGFEAATDGAINAVAGRARYPLEAGIYRWVRPPNAGDRALAAALIAASPFMIPL